MILHKRGGQGRINIIVKWNLFLFPYYCKLVKMAWEGIQFDCLKNFSTRRQAVKSSCGNIFIDLSFNFSDPKSLSKMPSWTMISSKNWKHHKSVKLLSACVRKSGRKTSLLLRREIKDQISMCWKVTKTNVMSCLT